MLNPEAPPRHRQTKRRPPLIPLVRPAIPVTLATIMLHGRPVASASHQVWRKAGGPDIRVNLEEKKFIWKSAVVHINIPNNEGRPTERI